MLPLTFPFYTNQLHNCYSKSGKENEKEMTQLDLIPIWQLPGNGQKKKF